MKTIIFDYAGVITPTKDKSDFAKQYHERFNMSFSELMNILYEDWNQASIGKISDKQYWENLGKKLNIDIGEIKKLIMDTFPIDQRIIKIIDQIKGRYTLVMVSNQIEDWLEKVIDDNNLRDKFDYFVNSYQVEVKKPNREIFLIALAKSNSKPEETLFIDDSYKNFISAKQLGLLTIQFDSYEQFIVQLKKIINLNK